jgi:hypothetical protein
MSSMRLLPYVFALLSLTIPFTARATQPYVSFSQFKEMAAPYVKKLTHEVVAYNYLQTNDDWIDPDSPRKQSEIEWGAKLYLDVNTTNPDRFEMGPGLHMASDPATSKYFGGSKWRLLAVYLKEGARYIDLRGAAKREILLPGMRPGEGFVVTLCGNDTCRERCTVLSVYGIFNDTSMWGCRFIARKLLSELGVQLVGYNWNSLSFSPCVRADDPEFGWPSNMAWVLADPFSLDLRPENRLNRARSAVNLEKTKLMTAALPAQPDSASRDRQMIEETVRRAGLFGHEDPFPGLARTISRDEFDEWSRERNFMCGNRYPADGYAH